MNKKRWSLVILVGLWLAAGACSGAAPTAM